MYTKTLLIVSILVAYVSVAHSATKIHAQYDEIDIDAVGGTTHRIARSRDWTLTGKGNFESKGDDIRGGMTSLGNEGFGTTPEGHPYKWSIHVKNGAIVMLTEFNNLISVFTLRTDSRNSCSLNIEFHKQKGHQDFEGTHSNPPHHYSDIHAENIVCRIEQTP